MLLLRIVLSVYIQMRRERVWEKFMVALKHIEQVGKKLIGAGEANLLESFQLALDFHFLGAFAEGVTFVVEFFSAADADADFD